MIWRLGFVYRQLIGVAAGLYQQSFAAMASALLAVTFLLAPFCVQAATAVGPDAADYVLGPGDSVKITVYDHPDLLTEARLSEAGKITFPLIGEIELDGLTPRQAERHIGQALVSGNFVRKPDINVLVLQFRSKQVSVLGHVLRPGRFPIDSTSKLSDFLAMAGGISPDGADVFILTRNQKGKTVKMEINQLDLFQDGDRSSDLQLQDGDVVFVPRAPMFYIYGEVQRPGNYRIEPGMTIMQALSVGGGPTARGSQRGMRLSRRDEGGSLQTREAKLDEPLRPSDVIYVRESLF